MRKLQLYVNNTRLDLFKDETVTINNSIQNVKDPAKIFADFTQTFTVPASKPNNKIFKHYYIPDIANGFDARNKVDALISINSIPFKKGFVTLTGVEMRNNKPYAYKITFYGETVSLKTTLGDDKLGALLKLEDYDLPYNSATVKARLQSASGPILCPLITSGASNDNNDLRRSRLFYNSQTITNGTGNLKYDASKTNGVLYTDLKYAIRIHEIIDAIQDEYPSLDFSEDFFSTANLEYYNLHLWLQRKKGSVQEDAQQNLSPSPVTGFGIPGTQTKTNMVNSAGLQIFGTDLPTITQTLILNTSSSDPYDVIVYRGTDIFASFSNQSGNQSYDKGDLGTMTAGIYTITIFSATQIVFTNASSIGIKWDLSGYNQGGGSGWAETWVIASFTASATFTFAIQAQIPDIKIIDFLTSIFNMFNLTAYFDDRPLLADGTENINYRKIRVQKIEQFYTNNVQVWDISQFVETDSRQINVALPYNEISFKYSGNDTILAKQYEQLNGKPFGAEEYVGTGEQLTAPNSTYTITIPQEHVMFERLIDVNNTLVYPNNETTVQYGYFVDDNQDAILGKPLLFYPIRQVNGTAISFFDGTNVSSIDDYFIPSNSLNLTPTNDSTNLNFFPEINEFTTSTGFDQTLFSNNYQTYIQDIFDNKRRLIKVKAILPVNVILKFNLNDTFVIQNVQYKINTIKINLNNGKSDIELLNNFAQIYALLTNVSYQNIARDVYYNSIIGRASNLVVGNVIYGDVGLTQTLGAGTYTQLGSAQVTTHCAVSFSMSMTLDSSGAITAISCAQP
tara:strand:+ start:44 stop:2422 length:2379 start_codon:yes stop_codon:yes gene_type:complete